MRWVLISLCAVCCGWLTACDKSSAPVDDPPQWVAEAKQRSVEARKPTAPPVLAEPSVDLVVERALIWSVESASGARSHLMGTFHVGTDFQGLGALPEEARTAFEASNKVVLEADPGATAGPEVQRLLALNGRKSLQGLLKPAQWDTLLEESGLPPRQLERMQPHVVVGLLAQKWIDEDAVRGMDGRFLILARAHSKKLVFLETVTEQLELLTEVVTVSMLADMLDDVGAEKARLAKALADYQRGDAVALTAWVFDPADAKAYPQLHERVFTRRNAKWVDQLKPDLDAGGAFIAVGVGHLLGPDSLPTLLAAEGYTVAPVGF